MTNDNHTNADVVNAIFFKSEVRNIFYNEKHQLVKRIISFSKVMWISTVGNPSFQQNQRILCKGTGK